MLQVSAGKRIFHFNRHNRLETILGMQIGSTTINLQPLLRQGRSCAQTYAELPVNLPTGCNGGSCCNHTPGLKHRSQRWLLIRMINMGRAPNPNLLPELDASLSHEGKQKIERLFVVRGHKNLIIPSCILPASIKTQQHIPSFLEAAHLGQKDADNRVTF